MAIGWMSSTIMSALSLGMTICALRQVDDTRHVRGPEVELRTKLS